MKTSIHKKAVQLQAELNAAFVERENAVRLALIALICKEHLLLLGPPGVAKSELIRFQSMAIGATCFQRLVTKFTTADDLFVSGVATAESESNGVKLTRIESSTCRMLPEAEIVFLDEIWKGSSAIANTLLTLLNERLYYKAGTPCACPLRSVFAASNEVPLSSDGLDAILDRFVLRTYVPPLSSEGRLRLARMMMGQRPVVTPNLLTIAEIDELNASLDGIAFPDDMVKEVARIPERMSQPDQPKDVKTSTPSDRRIMKTYNLLRANALLAGRTAVNPTDLAQVLPYVTWLTGPIATREPPEPTLRMIEQVWRNGNSLDGQTLRDGFAEAQAAYNALQPEIRTMRDLKLGNANGQSNDYAKRLPEFLNQTARTMAQIEAAAQRFRARSKELWDEERPAMEQNADAADIYYTNLAAMLREFSADARSVIK